MKVKIAEAARLAGVGRTTMARALKAGKISYTVDEKGERLIDPAEVARAYPGTARSEPRPVPRHTEVRAENPVVVQLLARIAAAERTIEDLRRERDQLLAAVLEREQRLLPAAPSWWRWWRR